MNQQTFSTTDFADALRPHLAGSVLLRGLEGFGAESRWQALQSWPLWVKREDELGFPCNGPKFRKMLSLGRYLQDSRGVISWGSSRSAFLFGLLQLCRSLALPAEIFLLKATAWDDHAVDAYFARLFQGVKIHWVDRASWPEVSKLAQKRLEASDRGAWTLVPEGGESAACLPGALTLPLEIVRQSVRLGLDLQSLWVDAGTGLTAQALILGLGSLLAEAPRVEVVLCAGDEESFARGLALRLDDARRLCPGVDWKTAPFVCRRPPTARSFGSCNRRVWQEVEALLQAEGLLVDPLYNAKLFLAYQDTRKDEPATGPELMIHSGGALSSFAFSRPFGLNKS